MRKHFVFLLIILLLIFTLSLLLYNTQQKRVYKQQAATLPTPLFDSFAGFNGEGIECIDANGNKFRTNYLTEFASDYATCRAIILSDIDYLGQHNVKIFRIWSLLSDYAFNPTTNTWGHLNNYIADLDEVLAEFGKNHMKAYVTVMDIPENAYTQSPSQINYFLNPALVQNQATQDAFIASFTEFITRYKDNPNIAAFDLTNEVSQIISNAPPPGGSGGFAGLFYDDTNFVKLKALFNKMYTVAKSIDKIHQFTFSSTGGASNPNSIVIPTLRNYVDYYDIHVYYATPAAYYNTFPVLDKPVIHGEAGLGNPVFDSKGNDCDPGSSSFPPPMNTECQQIFLTNTQAFVQQAKLHNIQHIFFQAWPGSNKFGMRTDDGTGKYLGHQMTLPGNYVITLDGGITDTPIPSLTPTPLPSPTIQPGETTASLTLCPHGIAHCGDNANPTSTGNTAPLHMNKPVTLSFMDGTNRLIATFPGTLAYDTVSGTYKGTVDIGSPSTGQQYLLKVKLDEYLPKQVPGIITVTSGQTNTIPSVSLVTGDVNNDNQLDLLDYNIIIGCFGSKQNTASCTMPPTTQTAGADINDDGNVDGSDYNLFLRELSVQKGG